MKHLLDPVLLEMEILETLQNLTQFKETGKEKVTIIQQTPILTFQAKV